MNVSRVYPRQADVAHQPSRRGQQRARAVAAVPPADAPVPLHLLVELLAEFHRLDLAYCYWKSSRRVPAALAGATDLDLLVARQDRDGAERVLLAQGFRLFPAAPGCNHPAVLSFLGYDESSGRICHVHLHMALVAGESLLKNYHLPWEADLLASAIPHPALPVRILDPAGEAVLLIVRASLELRWVDPVVLRRWPAVIDKFARDRAALAPLVDGAMIRARAATLMDAPVADMLAKAFDDRRPLEHQGRVLRHIRRAFAHHRSYNGIEARLRGIARALRWGAGSLGARFLRMPRPWRRLAPGGGIVVAVLGVDGSGKTSVTAAIRQWLEPEVDVLPIYFGTGDGRPSLLLLPLKVMVPLVTRFLGSKPRGASHGNVSERPPGLLYSVLLTGWATVLAAEKRLKLLAARRGADRGIVVIGDRYPQDEIATFNDGPLLPRLRLVPHWLRRFESRAYALARRLPPELVVKLIASPALLAVREPAMQQEVIRERVAQLQRLKFPGARVVCIDAGQPLADVIRAVKREIWRML